MPAIKHIWQRMQTAFNKLRFCYRVTATPASFVRLLLNTKKFRWSKGSSAVYENRPPVAYDLQLNNNRLTFFIRTRAGDMLIFYDIFWRAIYQLPTPVFQQATIIIDLGAHIGMAAAWFNMHAPQATLYCIEADEANYELLVKNLRPGIEKGQVMAIHAAINDTNDLVYLQRSARSYNSQLSTAITPFPVKGIRMQQFLHDYNITHIDILKIDIEGAESLLFNDDLSWLKITGALIIEIHSEENLRQFKEAVTRYGFRIEKKEVENENLYYAFNPACASAISST